MIFSFYKIQDYCSKNLPKVLLFFSFTTISSVSSAANTNGYKKHSKASQNPLRLNIYIHLFRYILNLLEMHFFFSLRNCINPFLRVSKKAAALSVMIFYHSQSRTSSATTCQSIYAVVPKCLHKTRTGRSAASFVYTSANITLAQPVLPAIDSKTFTD